MHPAGEGVVEDRVGAVDGRARVALVGIAEERAWVGVERPPIERRDAAIGGAVVAQMLVAHGERGLRGRARR